VGEGIGVTESKSLDLTGVTESKSLDLTEVMESKSKDLDSVGVTITTVAVGGMDVGGMADGVAKLQPVKAMISRKMRLIRLSFMVKLSIATANKEGNGNI